ncbi:hypothetical protein GUJ93_ZPchr0007g4317 [Zizania palustris]|uniref:Uncharacterized protein n=1 Tax=Zizania palustris TaxID=103762 RepID=A0A8J5W520_ZIZPA|nr:hypothetical protein GUJ93_ZPchr0007g4317 [Zizania palustris]
MMFMCFGGAAAAVADEEVATADGARHRSVSRRGSLSSLRSRFLYSASVVGKGRRSSAAGAGAGAGAGGRRGRRLTGGS